jgi:hypothetical protein
MGASITPLIEEGIHRDFPKPRKFGFTLTNTRDRQTVVSEAIVQSIRPESISILLGDRNGCRRRRVVCELRLIQMLQSIGGEVEVRGTETLDRREWDTGEGVEGDKVSVDFFGRRSSDMGHSRISGSHELGEPNKHMIGIPERPQRLHNVIIASCRLPRRPETPKKGIKEDVRVVTNLVTCDIPIRDEGVIRIRERSIVSHGRPASVGVFALGEELVDGIQGIRLDGIVCSEHDELGDICLLNQSYLSNETQEWK